MPFSQYTLRMNNRCSLIATAWAALVADGADPGGEAAVLGAFGQAANAGFPDEPEGYPEHPPNVEDLVSQHGLFDGSFATAITFPVTSAGCILERLFNAPGGHLSVCIITVAGTAFAIAVCHSQCWVFDSHGIGSSSAGAYVKSSWDILDVTRPLFASALLMETQIYAQINIFRDGLSLAPPPRTP